MGRRKSASRTIRIGETSYTVAIEHRSPSYDRCWVSSGGCGVLSSAFPSEPLSLMPSRSCPMVLVQGREAGAEPRAGEAEHGEHPPLARGSGVAQASTQRLLPDGFRHDVRLPFGELERTRPAQPNGLHVGAKHPPDGGCLSAGGVYMCFICVSLWIRPHNILI
jgi:hypothetical protein